MANNPKILLLDEPFANLDSQLRYKTKIWLKDLIKKQNLSAVLVTHDKKEALTISDKIGIIHNKKLLQFSTTKEIYKNPINYYTANFLSEINVLPKEVCEKLNITLEESQVAIVSINDCSITSEDNSLEVEIIDSSFCGDYYEIVAKLKEYPNKQNLIIHQKKPLFLEKDCDLFLNITKEDIKIILK